MRIRLLYSLILVLLSSNILSAQETQQKSKVFVYRPASFGTIGQAPWIYFDDVKKGQLNNNSYQIFNVLPGKHKIVIDGSHTEWSPGRAEIVFRTGANKEYFVRLGTPGQVDDYNPGRAASTLGTAVLKIVDSKLAQKEVDITSDQFEFFRPHIDN
jgi:hypothetical protein